METEGYKENIEIPPPFRPSPTSHPSKYNIEMYFIYSFSSTPAAENWLCKLGEQKGWGDIELI
jgi:hypothetical protein